MTSRTKIVHEQPAHSAAMIHAGMFLLLPSIALAAYMLTRRSDLPQVLGRWSWALAVLLVCDIALIAVVGFALRTHRPLLTGASILGLLVCSYAVGGNNRAQTEIMIVLVVLSRIGLALLLCILGFAGVQQNIKNFWSANRLLLVGALTLGWVTVDAIILGVVKALGQSAGSGFEFRIPVALGSVRSDDIAVIGDSMVWGQGVELAQAFPERIQDSLRSCGDEAHVYNLGQKGTGFPEYAKVLDQLPHVRRIILCTYPNDIVQRPTVALKLRQFMLSLGNTSGIFRIVADVFGVKMFPDAQAYVSTVIQDWNTTDPTYPMRWQQLENTFVRTARRAAEISREKPLFVVFPIMMNFANYPLRSVHRQWQTLGELNGLQVIDMLTAFELYYRNGDEFLAGPNDNHFNAMVHAGVADLLVETLHPGCLVSRDLH